MSEEDLKKHSVAMKKQLDLLGVEFVLEKIWNLIPFLILFAGISILVLFTFQDESFAEASLPSTDSLQELKGLKGFLRESNPFCFKGYWDDGLHLDSLNRDIRIKIGGRLQVDAGNIWTNDNLETAFPGIEGFASQVRRLRVSLLAAFYKRLDIKLEMDFSDVPTLTDGYFEIRKIPYVGHFQGGHTKEPFSLEELTSSNYISFMERSLPTDAFAPGRNIGFEIHNNASSELFTWALGGFLDVGTIDDRTDLQDVITNASGYNVTARVTGLPWFDEDASKLLHVGLNYSHKFRRTDNIELATRPESYLIEEKLVDTGKFSADDADLVDSELALVLGPFSLQTEFFQAFTTAAGDHFFWGYYAYLSYFLTGESRPYDKAEGIFSELRPRKDFDPLQGNWGAWELAFRHSYVDLDDGDVQGGKESNFTAGLNWYLNPNVRLMFNYIHARVNDRSSPGLNNGLANVVQGRFQIFF